ncbi:MAG: C4-dicarboxylate TRAP transporter substrate-binding protein [Synergistaceae bacterium]|nr:C4-dicarboxylate TRAP transporter substrate-binding protein [Synergistaceae bacterium]MBQ3694463.1 C4-dicarboxylate TRAP transporter substrate-binding protein [Synergistaceae bacterium]
MKKFLAVFMLTLLCLSASSAMADVVLQLGLENSISEPIGQAVTKWKELLNERKTGLTMEVFPDSQLGNKTDIIDQMLLGEPVMTLADGAFFADYGVPDMGIVFGPFLFTNWDQCWKLIASDWWKEQCEKLNTMGLKVVTSNWVYGERHTLTTKPVKTVEDLKGLQIRVPTNQIQTKGFEVLGATPVGMSLGDVYTALQQGTIDGGENPLSTLYGRRHHEVAKYLILDGHVLNYTNWICSSMWFDGLTPEQQKALVETGNEAGVFNNELQAKANDYYLDLMKKEGVTVTVPDEKVLEGFRAKAQDFYKEGALFKWSDGLYERVQEAMK